MGLTAMPIYNITKDTNVTELEDTMHSDNWMMRASFTLDDLDVFYSGGACTANSSPSSRDCQDRPEGHFFAQS